MKKIILFAFVLLVILAILSLLRYFKKYQYWPPAVESPPVYKSQRQERGNVIIEITPRVLVPGKQPVFALVFDTHSVDLDFDIAASSALTDESSASYGDAKWNGDPPGGHHRKGTLIFSKTLEKKQMS